MCNLISKASLVLGINCADATLLAVMLNKGLGTLQIDLDRDKLGNKLTISAWLDDNEDNPPNWSPVEVMDEKNSEMSYQELAERLGLLSKESFEKKSNQYYDGEPIPF
ncbi:hypothetical protein [Fusibacter ferrireducens]|uniref:Uncharacterized protein n=1 Tax=Fusibacter ferrireducens TaxID=2785058 RepID=A0ABR9ZX83_9FIRM|nr:hypothetical protein [Fusibacter ferrireducens]MBF4695082.1 hypothetical protein [Fusibacter ferrireducens]